jgi:PncC family amidohydrolase
MAGATPRDDLDAIAAAAAERHLRVATAESVTAGRIAQRLATGADASDWFAGGIVSYSSALKHDLLGVPAGPVLSARCAAAMVEGALALTGSDVGVASTGVGGPDPADGHPPGTVWIAVTGLGPTRAQVHRFAGAPDTVVDRAVEAALRMLRRRLEISVKRGPAAVEVDGDRVDVADPYESAYAARGRR